MISVEVLRGFGRQTKSADLHAEITTFSFSLYVSVSHNPRTLTVLSDVKGSMKHHFTNYLFFFCAIPEVSLASPVLLPSINQIRAFGAYFVSYERPRAAEESTNWFFKHRDELVEMFLDWQNAHMQINLIHSWKNLKG